MRLRPPSRLALPASRRGRLRPDRRQPGRRPPGRKAHGTARSRRS